MKTETITILLPTFNRREFLPRALKCIQEQSFRDWKCLVVNDGGEDVSACVEALNDPRFEYFDRPHLGKPAALNFGLSQAKGEYIAYMDDDDEIFPRHLEVLYQAAVEHGAGFVFSDTYETHVEKTTGKILTERVENDRDVTPEMLVFQNYINHKQILHKKELADRIGGYDEQLPILIDYDFIRRLAKAEPPFHVRAITGRHYLYCGGEGGVSITGLWEKDPAACGNALIRIYGKAPADLTAFFRRSWDAINAEPSLREELAKRDSELAKRNSELQKITSSVFFCLYNRYERMFPMGSRQRNAMHAIRKILFPFRKNKNADQ